MAYVSLWREGAQPTVGTPRHIPVGDCIQHLHLNQYQYRGEVPPKVVGTNPHLDGVRNASGTVVHLTRQEAPAGWLAGWYMISSTDLSVRDAARLLEQYPEAELDAWQQ
jgi:hypothetical protein